jgi:hypothetical protein
MVEARSGADDINVTAKTPRAPRGGFNYELWILSYEWKSFKTWRSGVLAVKFPTVFEAFEGVSAHANIPPSCVATRRHFLARRPIPALKRGPTVMRRQRDFETPVPTRKRDAEIPEMACPSQIYA